jgi:hypothetical protein
MRKTSLTLSLGVAVLGTLVLTVLRGPLPAGSAAPNGHDLLVAALTNARKNSSYELYSAFTASGSPSSMTYFVTATGQETVDSEQETGTVFFLQPSDAHRVFIRATTVHALLIFLSVRAPRASEVNRWFYLAPSDKRYTSMTASGPRTIATQFVIGPHTFGSAAKYEGVTSLRGTKVIKLGVNSSMMSPTNALVPTVLYITDSSRPLPYAIEGKINGISSTVTSYFLRWDSVPKLHVPSSHDVLPQ